MLIGEVARRSGVSARMLRHYDSLGLVRPTGRTGGGYREYADEDIRRIFHVESLRSLGLSLQEVGRALDDPGFAPSKLVDNLIGRTRERIAAETALLTRLSRIDAAEPAGWEDVLQVVALLQGLGSESAGKRQRAALASGPSGPSGPSAKEVAVPVEALVEAALSETDPHVAGALRWALAQSGDGGLPLLAEGLGTPVAAVRRRAVRSVAEFPGGEATALLRGALTDSDVVVRRCAALALGARGMADAVPTLVAMVVDGANDVDAADALRTLATGPATPDLSAPADRPAPPDRTTSQDQIVSPDRTTPADRIAAALVDRLARSAAGSSVRRRLTQALAEIPGPTATQALADLSHDEDRAVALTAAYVLTLRATRQDDARS
ncbi:HEAT repeat domain-containing protein [Streptomyces sp. NBC_00111]|uniref:HEAT repeat domain-containing protein n=1 Tax=Streptomyces sp. NBC_00111 TaxID=2975655 RepID=UPI0032566D6D